MDDDVADVLGLLEPHVRPRLPAVDGLPHAVAVRDVAADRILASADIDDVGRRGRDFDGADGAAEVSVGHRRPGLSAIHTLEHSAARRPLPEFVRPLRVSGDGNGPSAAEGAQLAPAYPGEGDAVEGSQRPRRRHRVRPNGSGRRTGARALLLCTTRARREDREERDDRGTAGRGAEREGRANHCAPPDVR